MNTTSTTLNVTHQYTPITPSNTTDFASLTRAIYVGGAGNVAVVRFDGTVVTFSNVAAGSVLPVSARRVNSSGTTATGLCALFGRLERTPFWVPNSFSPLDLSPVLWLDASDTSTITESGGAVSQWDDKSGNGNHVVQGTAALQPTTGTRTINGLNVLDFDGTNDHLSNSVTDWGANISIFAVHQIDPPLGFYGILDATTSLTFASSYGVRFDAGNNFRMGISADGSGSFAQSTDNTNLTLQTGTYDGTTIRLRINGTETATSTAESGDISYTGVTGTLIGALFGPDYTYNGVIAEMIVVDAAVDAGEIAATEAYLADKWGITI